MPKQICYNCGIELDDKDVTREHIPARNLFEGYDVKYKMNRITVSACSECNGQYSPNDEEFRNMIGIIAKKKENNKITEKSVRSILRKDRLGQRLTIDSFGKVSGVTFNEIPIENYHKKNFKGLFYHQYKRFLIDDYKLFVNIDENDWSDFTLGILEYLKNFFNWNHSGHPDIMKFVIQPFRLGITNEGKQDLLPKDGENMFVGYLEYNNEHSALVIAVRAGWLEEIRNKKNYSVQQ